MNKKFLGIKISTILQLLVCVILAFVIWFVVQYTNSQVDNSNTEVAGILSCIMPDLR